MRASARGGILVGAMGADTTQARIHALADLIVRFGANVQPGQIVAIGSEPGKEPLARAIAEAAYKAGAKFVDLSVFDIHLKRARVLHAAPDTLGFVPPWYGERMRALGEHRCAPDRAHRPGRAARHGRDRPGAARQGPAAAGARVDRDRQPAHHELDGRAVPDPGVGRAGPPGRLGAGRARAPVARRRARLPRRRARPGGRLGGADGRADGGRRQARRAAARRPALRGAGDRADRRRCCRRAGGIAPGSRPSTASSTRPTSRPRRCSPRPTPTRRRLRPLDQAAVRLRRADHRPAGPVRGRNGGRDRRRPGRGHAARADAGRDPGRLAARRGRAGRPRQPDRRASTRSSSTPCSTRTPRATSRSARVSTSRSPTRPISSGSTAASSTSTS